MTLRRFTRWTMVALTITAGSSLAQTLIPETTSFAPPGTAAGDRFGDAMTMEGSLALIGAPMEPGGGAAYLYDLSDPANPVMLSELLPNPGPTGQGRFGYSVALHGTVAVVGAPSQWQAFPAQSEAPGMVYVFDITDPGSPVQTAILSATDGFNGDEFGFNVDINDDVLAVGAPGRYYNINGTFCGFADYFLPGQVYLIDASAFTELSVIGMPGSDCSIEGFQTPLFGRWGTRVLLHDDLLIASAAWTSDDINQGSPVGNSGGGLIAPFDISNPSTPTMPFEFCGGNGEHTGDAIAILDDVVIAPSALGVSDNSLWSHDLLAPDDTFPEVCRQNSTRSQTRAQYDLRNAIAAANGLIFVRYDTADTNGTPGASVEAFELDAQRPDLVAAGDLELVPSTSQAYLTAVAASGKTVLVGTDEGEVLVFDLSPSSCLADFNGSGAADVFDILDFLDAWNMGLDYNGSGAADIFDILDFLAVWDTGCP